MALVRDVEKEAKDRKEEMIQRIKDCGQYIIDNAENILGEEKYISDLYLTCNFFDRSEPPYITINKYVVPIECALVFTNNGSDFYLEPVGK